MRPKILLFGKSILFIRANIFHDASMRPKILLFGKEMYQTLFNLPPERFNEAEDFTLRKGSFSGRRKPSLKRCFNEAEDFTLRKGSFSGRRKPSLKRCFNEAEDFTLRKG